MEDVLGGRVGGGLALPVAELCGPAGMERCGRGGQRGETISGAETQGRSVASLSTGIKKVSLASQASGQGQEMFVSRAGRWQWDQHPLASEGKRGEDGHRVPDGD